MPSPGRRIVEGGEDPRTDRQAACPGDAEYEAYRNRRLPIAVPPTVVDPATGAVIPTPSRTIAKARCDALRALMKMEMPERWTDVSRRPRNVADQAGQAGVAE